MAEAYALLDALGRQAAHAALLRCCGSERWVGGMLEKRPFGSQEALASAAESVWAALSQDDYLEAFSHHPAIGADPDELAAKFASTRAWSSSEQAGVEGADRETLVALSEGNRAYRKRFGYTFIVCASGQSAREMLTSLQQRLGNEPAAELLVAAGEQAKITWLRLQKLAAEPPKPGNITRL